MPSKLVAHRGQHPENTLFAFKQAFARGFTVAECDVQVTADGEFILCHDTTLARTACSDSVDLNTPIASLKFTQLATIKVGDQHHQENVPRLQDLLPLLPEAAILLLEIKFTDASRLASLLTLINPYLDKVIIISFDLPMLKAIRQQHATVKMLLLTSASDNAYQPVVINSAASLKQAQKILEQYQFAGIGFEYSAFINAENLQTFHQQYLSQLWYSQRDKASVEKIIAAGQAAAMNFVNVD